MLDGMEKIPADLSNLEEYIKSIALAFSELRVSSVDESGNPFHRKQAIMTISELQYILSGIIITVEKLFGSKVADYYAAYMEEAMCTSLGGEDDEGDSN